LLIPTEATKPLVVVNVPDDYFCMAGFEVIMYGRLWMIPEVRSVKLKLDL
jgi:hypothetical protein